MIHNRKNFRPIFLLFVVFCLPLPIINCATIKQSPETPVITNPLDKAASYIPTTSCIPGWRLKGETRKINSTEFNDQIAVDYQKYINADCIGASITEYEPENNSEKTVKISIFTFNHFRQANAVYKSEIENGKKGIRLGDEGNFNRYEYRFRKDCYYIKVSIDTLEAKYQEAMKKLAYCLNDNLIGGARDE